MNSTEKHETRERRRISAMLKRHMNKSVNEILGESLRELTPTTKQMIQRMAEFADAVNNPVDNG